MSRTVYTGSLPDDIQLIQTNSSRRDSSSINNQISEQEKHLIEFLNETITVDNNSIHTNNNNIKQDNKNQNKRSSKRSMFFFFYFLFH